MPQKKQAKNPKKSSFLTNPLLLKIITVICIGVLFSGYLYVRDTYFRGRNSVSTTIKDEKVFVNPFFQDSNDTSTDSEKTISKAISKHFYTGNIFWGRYIDDWSYQAKNNTPQRPTELGVDDRDFNYPFSGLNTFNLDQYQAVIGGLECPITSEFRPSREQERALKFSCLPQYLPFAKEYFDVFSLANNHTDNMQEVDGYANTQRELEKNNIQYFGHFDNAQTVDICEIVSLPIQVSYDSDEVEEKSFPFALCGYHNVFKLPTETELSEISKYSRYFPTIVMPHQGAEYKVKGDRLQTTTFQSMIDFGADAVLSDHPHYAQNIEVYNNKLIVHSMGNFIFDQQFNYDVTHAIAMDVLFSFDVDTIQPFVDLDASFNCKIYKDVCLSQAQIQDLKKPQFDITYDIVPVDSTNKLTKKGDDSVLNYMIQRTRWGAIDESLKQLKE